MIEEARLQALVRMDVAQRLRSNDLKLTVGNFVLALLVAASVNGAAPLAWTAGWLGLQFVSMVFHLWLGLRWLRRPLTQASAPIWLRRVTRTSGLNGLLWLLAVQLFWPGGSDVQRMLLWVWMLGISGAALHSLHAYMPAYAAIVGPALSGVVLAVLVHGGAYSWIMVAAVLLGGGAEPSFRSGAAAPVVGLAAPSPSARSSERKLEAGEGPGRQAEPVAQSLSGRRQP